MSGTDWQWWWLPMGATVLALGMGALAVWALWRSGPRRWR